MPIDPPLYLQPLISLSEVVVVAAVSIVAFIGLRRAELTTQQKRSLALLFAVVGALWLFGAELIGHFGPFAANTLPGLARLPVLILAPVAIFGFLLLQSRRMATVVDAIPQSLLIGVQAYRAVGFVFVVLALQGRLPYEFTLPAGLGDLLVGVLALPVAGLIATGGSGATRVAVAWNVLGILDLVVAVSVGFLASPTNFQLLAFETPNVLISHYPLVMIPIFLVPLSLLLHMLSLWQVYRRASAQYPTPAQAH